MDFVQILNTLKGQKLDQAHVELLLEVFKLQNQTLQQAHSTHSVLKENNDLLKQKIHGLEGKIRKLRQYVFEIESGSVSPEPAGPAQSIQEFSDVAESVLKAYLQQVNTEFSDEVLNQALPYSRKQIRSALAELSESGMIQPITGGLEGGTFSLTDGGKSYALTLNSED